VGKKIAVAASAAAAMLAACAGLLGTDDVTYAPAADAAPVEGAPSASDAFVANDAANDVADGGGGDAEPPPACDGSVVDFSCTGDAGLVAYWSFDNDPPGMVHDCAGTNDGVLSPPDGSIPVHTLGRQGLALTLDGGGQFVDFGAPGPLLLKSAFTISAWVQPVNDTGTILVNEGEWAFRLASRSASLTVRLVQQGYRTASGGVLLGSWTHIAGVFSGNAIEVWVDGVMKDRQTFDGETLIDGAGVLLGTDPTVAGGSYFTGAIDDLRVFGRPLSECEIGVLARP
jgi:hypothetical protein